MLRVCRKAFKSTPPATEKTPENKKEEAGAEEDDDEEGEEYVISAQFPEMPASVPLTYTLAMHACLSAAPEERPTFEQVPFVLLQHAFIVALA